jgi:hypothetical protein
MWKWIKIFGLISLQANARPAQGSIDHALVDAIVAALPTSSLPVTTTLDNGGIPTLQSTSTNAQPATTGVCDTSSTIHFFLLVKPLTPFSNYYQRSNSFIGCTFIPPNIWESVSAAI